MWRLPGGSTRFMSLEGRKILLGVTGGIAAYKTPELVRELIRAGAEVRVVMTRGAERFVTETTLQAVSTEPVRTTLWDPASEAAMGHIELARWADLVLIAPATAHTIAKLAAGLADDLLSTICLATTAPVAIAPAMNQQMWQHRATVRNVARLVSDGVRVFGPASGEQACGEFGPGRMLEPAAIADCARRIFTAGPLTGVRVLLTAGPTREPIDPVRYISNSSSGKQGFALAQAFVEAGASVTVVSGPVALTPPADVDVVHVETAAEMCEAVMARIALHDIFVGVAAVADYRPVQVAEQKIKKVHDRPSISLELTENPDIIATVARAPSQPFVVGFAAETENVIAHAKAKLMRKGLDLIVVNDVADERIGFASDENAVTVIGPTSEERLAIASKIDISRALVERIHAAYAARARLRKQPKNDGANE